MPDEEVVIENHSPQPRILHNFEFHGRSGEFFRIWIVNLVLSIVTFGIYSAWAKVRTTQYFYGNTILDGSAFEYTASPIQILKGRLIAMGMLLGYAIISRLLPGLANSVFILGALLVPAIIVLSMAFRMRYSSWRGINFGFNRNFGTAYLLFLPLLAYLLVTLFLPGLLGISEELISQANGTESTVDDLTPELSTALLSYFEITGTLVIIGGLLFPWWQKMFYLFVANNTRFGSTKFQFNAITLEFYSIYIGAFLVLLTSLVVLGIAAALLLKIIPSEAAVLLTPVLFLPYAMTVAYIQTKRTNIIYSNLLLDEIGFSSNLEAKRMMWLYATNTLAILLSFGMAIPWAMIRMARYRASTMQLLATDFSGFAAAQAVNQTALGDGASDIFDIEIGI